MEEDSVVLCQALFQCITEEEWREMTKPGQRVAGLGKVVWRRTLKDGVFLAKEEQVHAFHMRSALHESLEDPWPS